jgi:threonine synthase
MVHAFAEGRETIQPKHVVARPAGIADAILRGDPTRVYPRIRRIVLESRGGLTAVSEAEIRAARKSVQVHEGISPCFSASTAIAGLIKSVAAGLVDRDATIVINLTGGDRPDAQTSSPVHWIERTEEGWNAPPPAALMPDIALAD